MTDLMTFEIVTAAAALFVGFAPAEYPTVAVGVALQLKHGGFGGTTAGPIAALVIGSMLRSGGQAGTGG